MCRYDAKTLRYSPVSMSAVPCKISCRIPSSTDSVYLCRSLLQSDKEVSEEKVSLMKVNMQCMLFHIVHHIVALVIFCFDYVVRQVCYREFLVVDLLQQQCYRAVLVVDLLQHS